jgi:hypothetical protein
MEGARQGPSSYRYPESLWKTASQRGGYPGDKVSGTGLVPGPV